MISFKTYILNKTKKKILIKRNIKLIHPYRINQKYINNKIETRILKDRHKVEKLFATLKQFKKIQNRYETKIASYKAYLYIALIFMGYRIIINKT